MTKLWILQIRSDNDGPDLIYTSQGYFDDKLKAAYFDIWVMGGVRSNVEPGRFTLIRESDNVILAQLWREY